MDASTLEFYEHVRGPLFPEVEGAGNLRETLMASARQFLTSPHLKSRGKTRIQHIKKYYKKRPWRALRECARHVGDACRCFACPQCRLWDESNRPWQPTAAMRCSPGNRALKTVFAEMMGGLKYFVI